MSDAGALTDQPKSTQIGSPDLGVFYGQLSGLLNSGMPLPGALRMLSVESGSRRFRAALERAAASMERGTDPATAFQAESSDLGGMLGSVAAAAAASGRLAPLLSELSAWTLVQDRLRRRIIDALMYPYTVLFFSSLLSVAMMLYVVTAGFGDPCLDFEVVSMSSRVGIFETPKGREDIDVLAWAFNAGTLAVLAAIPILSVLSSRSQRLRQFKERMCIRIPLVGALCRPLALSRFCGAAAILMKAGTPYHQAVLAAGSLTGFEPYEAAASRAAARLRDGHSPSEVWSNDWLFPASLRFILNAAGIRGDTPQSFSELAELYQVEAEGRGRMLAFLAPSVCLIWVGVVISLLISWMFVPMINVLNLMMG